MFRMGRRLAVIALSAGSALALAVPAAQAGPISDNADCAASQPLSQPFVPWADIASYALAPDGGLEGGGAGWSLAGSAATAAGNESYHVGNAADSTSLSVPSGSSAISAPTCVGLLWPTIKLFTRSSATGFMSSLRVEVLFDSALTGATRALPIGVALPSGSWQPTLPMVMVMNTFGALSKDGMIPVAFRFTPVGSGSWQIDDLYVDPWRGP
jgi:hypothetical protein